MQAHSSTNPPKEQVPPGQKPSSPQAETHQNGKPPANEAAHSNSTGCAVNRAELVARIRTNFPKELQDLNQWVVWRYEPNPKKPKPDKVPYDPATGYKASVKNPHTWGSFEQACQAYLKGWLLKPDLLGDYSGLGFMFSADDPYTGIDFDGYVQSRMVDATLWDYAAPLDGYKEFSPSERGVHSIVRAKLSGKGKRDDNLGIEMYDQGRFFTVTGDTLPDASPAINDCQEAVAELYDRLKQASPPTSIQLERSNAQPDEPGKWADDYYDDDWLWKKMFASAQGAKLSRLYNGDMTDYIDQEHPEGNHSRADLGLCDSLAWWTRKDAERIDRMFRQTELYRDKWERQDYHDDTISKAIKGKSGQYTPPRQGNSTGVSDGAEAYLLTEGIHDEGNAQTVNQRYKQGFCRNPALGWMRYTGTHWERSGAEDAVERAITETLIARAEAGLHSAEPQRYKELISKSVPNAGKVAGAKSQLSSLVYADDKLFDASPDHLNCANGVVDLRTGKITPHSPNQRFSYCLPVVYNPQAKGIETWVNWLSGEVTGGHETVKWLKQAFGYTLTGYTSEEILFYLFGPARSGKGTLTETILSLLGKPLAAETAFGMFTAKRDGDSQNFDLAPLKPCRFVAASESKSYERFNEAMLKQVTGGNDIYCAHKHQTPFNYKPQFKIWLSSNHPINADPDDDAVWGRIRAIEFHTSHLGSEDKELKRKMRSPAMLEAVLAWAIEGAMEWYALGSAGLPELSTGVALKAEHRGDLDTVQAWFDERCELRPGNFVTHQEAYHSYEAWCKINGVEPKKSKGFSQAVNRKGFTAKPTKLGDKTFRGFNGFACIVSDVMFLARQSRG